MIPRTIHQIWLGGPLPGQYVTWRKRLMELHPGWDVRLWTRETLPDYDSVMDYHDLRGYHPSIASDIFRVMVVARHGGFYLDCDTEPIACMEPLRCHTFLCRWDGWAQLFAGHELRINSGDGFGAEAGSPILSAYMDRCAAMRGSQDSVLYRIGFLGFSEHLWERRSAITMLTKQEMERYYRHEGKMGWVRESLDGYRAVLPSKPLEEPFRKQVKPPRPWPAADEMLKHNRGPDTGCCSRPSIFYMSY
ncbi:MAG: hypothetical protein GYA56_01265 [Geobacteraceae bacterium]|nr:hypothetical protein [Geobacteraceae bacterium]